MTAPLLPARFRHAMVAVSKTQVLIAGGTDDLQCELRTAEFSVAQLYDVESNSYKELSAPREERYSVDGISVTCVCEANKL